MNSSPNTKHFSFFILCILALTIFTLPSRGQTTIAQWKLTFPEQWIYGEGVMDDNDIYHVLVDDEYTASTQMTEIDSNGNILSVITIETLDSVWPPRYLDRKLNSYVSRHVDTSFYELYSFDKLGNERWHVGANFLSGIQMLVDNSGDVFSGSYSGGTYYSPLIKIDSSGNLLWTVWPDTALGTAIYRDAAVNDLGEIFLCGRLEDNNGEMNFYVIKLNSDGTTAWTWISAGGGELRSLALDDAGNVYTAGYFQNTMTDTNTVITTKLSPLGAEIWSATDSGYGMSAADVAIDSESNVIVSGDRYQLAGWMGSVPYTYVTKYDGSGNQLWNNTFDQLNGYDSTTGFWNSVSARGIAVDPSNNIVLKATYAHPVPATGNNDNYCILRYSPEGQLQWYWTYDSPYTDHSMDDLRTVDFDSHGNIVAAGFSQCCFLCICTDNQVDVFKLTGDTATIIPCNAYFTLVPDSFMPHHYWAIPGVSGMQPMVYKWTWGDGSHSNTLYASHTYDTAGFYHICLKITDATGCTDHTCVDYSLEKFEQTNEIVTINVVDSIPINIPTNIQNGSVLQSCSVFPNPAAGSVYLNYSLSTAATVHVELFDIIGNKLQQLTLDRDAGEYNSRFDIKDLPNGIYYLKVQAGGAVASQKVVVMN